MNELLREAKRVYLDTNCIIYFVEQADERKQKISDLIAHAIKSGIDIVCSEIGVAECFYGAYKLGNLTREAYYSKIFYEISLFKLCPVNGEALMRAAKLGAENNLKLVDAVHFLAATEHKCDLFVTNDTRFKSSHSVHVIQLSDL